MALVIGSRTTAQAATESRLVRRVDARIALVEPNIAPLVTLMMRMKKRSALDTIKREWIEDDYCARWAQNSAAAVANNTSSTTVTVTDGTLFVAGQLFCVPKATTATGAPEVIRVASISGNALTVVRAIGGDSTVDTIAANASLRLIGTAYEQGSKPPTSKTTAKSTIYNLTQIFKSTIDYSKTNVAVRQYGVQGSDRDWEQAKKLKEHKTDIGTAMMWGVRSEGTGPDGKPLNTMGGLNYYIASNITDVGGTLNRKVFETFSRQAFRYGSKEKILLAAPIICSAINEWGNSWLQVKPGETKIGVQLQQIYTAHGVWLLVNDWMLEDGVAAQNGFGHVAFSVDMEQLEYNYLSNNGENRDTHIKEDVIKDGRDAYVDEILTECTMKVGMEKYHAKMQNVTDYIA